MRAGRWRSRKVHPLNALIVENDDLLRDSLVRMFRTKGWHVDGFGSAEAVVPALEAGLPDVLICDEDLPGMDGLTLLERLGGEHPGTVTILICAHPNSKVAEKVKRSRIDGCLLKPFSTEELENLLACLQGQRSHGVRASS